MNTHNQIVDICMCAMQNEYKFGSNDCNFIVLQVLDLLSGTDYSKIAKYTTVKQGIKQLNKLGFESTQDIIKKHGIKTSILIDGDIWLSDDNPLIMGVVISNRLLGVDEDHTEFQLLELPTDGKYYRIPNII